MFLKESAKKGQNNRKIGEKWEKHKNKVLFTLFEKGTLLGMIVAPKSGLEQDLSCAIRVLMSNLYKMCDSSYFTKIIVTSSKFVR